MNARALQAFESVIKSSCARDRDGLPSLTLPGFRLFIHAAMFALFAGAFGVAHAQVARMEIHSFQSMTLTDQEFLVGRKEGKPVTVAGELRLPPGTGRFPLVVLAHGSGGVSGNVTDWEQDLNAMGVATFVFDSFTPRGVTSVINDQSQLGRLVNLLDAYRALEALEKHPRVDPARIVIMGFSRGATAALYASVKRFQRLHGPASGREFAAYVAFYPPCETTFIDDGDVLDKPIRIFHGNADDYHPVARCRPYVERLKARGSDVQLIEYPGAHHVFDWLALKKPVKLEKAQTERQCQLEEARDGRIMNAKTSQPFTWADPCVEYGTTLAYDEKGSVQARKAVREFFSATLKP